MIESELRADPQFKTVDKTELKGDKKPKVKGAATNLLGADKELTHLEKAWSETANESHAEDPSVYYYLYRAFTTK